MSIITRTLNDTKANAVCNFMGGESFTIDPLTTLKMVCASSLFGEPQYYRNGIKEKSYLSQIDPYSEYFVFNRDNKNTKDYMESIIDEALDYDFKGTLMVAKDLRKNFFIRINPQVIMVRAALHPKRVLFNKENPGLFSSIQHDVMARADEPATQLSYYLLINDNNKSKLPSILKRTWAEKIESLSKYQLSKYKNAEIGMIDLVRICHANSPFIDELMQTGKIEIEEDEMTWENLKSDGKTWLDILNGEMKLPHMALLKNLRGIFSEITESDENRILAKRILNQLVNGVEKGKQFPYRYYVAYNIVKGSEISYKVLVLEALEKCLQFSLNNMPTLDGKTMILSDNSGSAWKTLNSEYGSVKVAEIGNLSAVLTAMRCDEGYVGVFGDKLYVVPISKCDSILTNLEKVNELGEKVGHATENGIWLFFEDAINNKKHYDNVFIYSDMQAGRSQLYCTDEGTRTYNNFVKKNNLTGAERKSYVNVLELVNHYRHNVNSKLNVFSVQTAGYNNSVLPNYMYRGSLLYGWTGKETVFAKTLIEQWNNIDQH